MDLEVVGRHALLFDDDAMASFVNSPAALVDWNSLSIDRYDVRHLLSGSPPPRKRRRLTSSPPQTADGSLESELDRERYLDLPPPSPSPSDQQDEDHDLEPATAGGVYNAVRFSYGNTGESVEQKDTNVESSFQPPFSVPESLLQNLPPTEKVHQIMARTAMFVSRHGSQSEIVLRVKQGDNPTFGFLMPDHQLHPYFRYLVDHQELLTSNSVDEEIKAENALNQADSVRGGSALSLLGAVYGSGEDEEGATEHATERKHSVEAVDAINKTSTDGPERKESSVSAHEKDESLTKFSAPLKEKASVIKRNRSITTVKPGTTIGVKKESDASPAEKSGTSSLPTTSKVELPVVEPPSDIKRVVDKIVEFIIKNGRQFEEVLVEQDVKHGRFPFLLPSNLYHRYYLKVLRNAEKSKLPGKGFVSEKHDSSSLGVEEKAATSQESDIMPVASDIPFDSDRKEKFKMVISKSKKDGQDPPPKETQPQLGVSVDAAAAAAILQAATRGMRKPNLEFLSKTSVNGSSQAPSSEGGRTPSLGSLLSSQTQSSFPELEQKGEPGVSGPVANAIAKTAAIAAAGEADSSEASLTKEEKLKAERLKRAKMFAAMIKKGVAPLKRESSRGLSVELPESGGSGPCVESESLSGKLREGSSVLLDVNAADRTEKPQNTYSGCDHNEPRSKRKYRSRLSRREEDCGQEDDDEEKDKDHKHLGKKRRSHHSSHHGGDRHRHRRRHSSSKDRHSRHQHKHDSSSDDERGHKSDSSDSDHHHSLHRQKRDSSSDAEHWRSISGYGHNDSSQHERRHSRCRHKHDSSSEDEDRRSRTRHKHRRSFKDEHRHRGKKSHSGRKVEMEEGEICGKSDQSKLSEGNGASRETSVGVSKPDGEGRAPSLPSETNTVSDDLRAKIRAMLMATL